MALIKRKEFIEKCGITNANFTTYRGRNNIVVTSMNGEEYVDDANPVNAAFIAKRQQKMATACTVKPIKTTATARKNENKAIADAAGLNEDVAGLMDDDDEQGQPPKKGNTYERYQLAMIDKTTQQTSILAIQKEKLMGQLIPKDAVMPVIQRLSQALLTSYSQAFENFIVEVEKKAAVEPNVIAEFRVTARRELNNAVGEGIEAASADVDHIVNEYAATRGRGQRKVAK